MRMVEGKNLHIDECRLKDILKKQLPTLSYKSISKACGMGESYFSNVLDKGRISPKIVEQMKYVFGVDLTPALLSDEEISKLHDALEKAKAPEQPQEQEPVEVVQTDPMIKLTDFSEFVHAIQEASDNICFRLDTIIKMLE